jgi:hypothetical protein
MIHSQPKVSIPLGFLSELVTSLSKDMKTQIIQVLERDTNPLVPSLLDTQDLKKNVILDLI